LQHWEKDLKFNNKMKARLIKNNFMVFTVKIEENSNFIQN